MSLRPLLNILRLPADQTIAREVNLARQAALQAAIASLETDDSPAAQRLKVEYGEALMQVRADGDLSETPDNVLRLKLVAASRRAIDDLRNAGTIGDDAYRRVEAELDRLELSAGPAEGP
jgi:monovalent cation/hydrogen antiporter